MEDKTEQCDKMRRETMMKKFNALIQTTTIITFTRDVLDEKQNVQLGNSISRDHNIIIPNYIQEILLNNKEVAGLVQDIVDYRKHKNL